MTGYNEELVHKLIVQKGFDPEDEEMSIHSVRRFVARDGIEYLKVLLDFGVGGIKDISLPVEEITGERASSVKKKTVLEDLSEESLRAMCRMFEIDASGGKVQLVVRLRKHFQNLAASGVEGVSEVMDLKVAEAIAEEVVVKAADEDEGESVSLEDKDKDELLAYAEANEIKVYKSWSKGKILDAIIEAES